MLRRLYSLKTWFLFLPFIVFAGCVFSPHEEYINPVNPRTPAIQVEVNTPNFSDPYYLTGATSFYFTLNGLDEPVISHEVYINNTTLVYSGMLDNRLWFDFPLGQDQGTFNVSIRIRIATHSGSLADKLGAEYYLVEKNFKVVVDRVPPALTKPLTAAYENGALTVRWGATDKKNFKYVIRRVYQPYHNLNDTIVYNTSQDHFVDPGYVGGEVTYKLMVTGLGFEQFELGSVHFDQRPVDYKIDHDAQGIVNLSWTNSLINPENTTVNISGGGREISVPLKPTGNMVIDTLCLGEEVYYWVETGRAKYPMQTYQWIEQVVSPPDIKEFHSTAMLAQSDKLLVVSSNTLYRYSLPDLIIEDSLTALQVGMGDFSSVVVNATESNAVIVVGASKLVGFDPKKFEDRTVYGINAAASVITYGDPITTLELGNLSDNNLLTMTLAIYGRIWGVVYDVDANILRWNSSPFSYLNPVRPPAISNDGNYMVYDLPANYYADVFQWSGSDFTKIATVADGLKFFRNSTNELISTTYIEPYHYAVNPRISIYNLSTASADPNESFGEVRVFSLPPMLGEEYLWEMRYDDATESLYTIYRRDHISKIRLHDVVDFHQTGEMRAMSSPLKTHIYTNNYHFISKGFIQNVK